MTTPDPSCKLRLFPYFGYHYYNDNDSQYQLLKDFQSVITAKRKNPEHRPGLLYKMKMSIYDS